MPWTEADIPDQRGRVIVITGANSGLGLAASRLLAQRGAHVVMACRSLEKAEAVAAPLRASLKDGVLEPMTLDVSSLKSVRSFGSALAEKHPRVDVLMNNAGVMAVPRALTADGFELQFGTNHLGHFALTSQVLPLLEKAEQGRIVNVASNAHYFGRIDFDDLMGERRYAKWSAYGQSKLANLLFTYELERWLRKNGKRSIAVAAHPGYTATNLQGLGPQLEGAAFTAFIMRLGNAMMGQAPEMGALPQLYAATHPEMKGGQYVGPDGLLGQSGFPKLVTSNAASRDEAVAAKLWQVSTQLTSAEWR